MHLEGTVKFGSRSARGFSRTTMITSWLTPGETSSPSPVYVSFVPALKPARIGTSSTFSADRCSVRDLRVILSFLVQPR